MIWSRNFVQFELFAPHNWRRYRRDSCALGDAGKEWPGTSAGDSQCYVSYRYLSGIGLLGDSQILFLVNLIAGLKSVEDTWDMIFSSQCGDDGFLGRFLNTPFEEVQIGELIIILEGDEMWYIT